MKIAVAAREGGRCRQRGSSSELWKTPDAGDQLYGPTAPRNPCLRRASSPWTTVVAHGEPYGAGHQVVALVGLYELLMMIIRGAKTPTAVLRPHDGASVVDPLEEQVAVVFAADRVPSERAIHAALHVGQPRAAAARVSCRNRRSARRKPGRMSGDPRAGGSVGLSSRLFTA